MSGKQLAVPYRSQWAEDAASHNADCGPTCVAMMLNYYGIDMTPDEGYLVLSNTFNRHFGGEEYTRTSDLRNILNHKGVASGATHFGNKAVAIAVLKQRINEGKPFIALVNYKPWQKWTGNRFAGSHFVVVTGYDDSHVYVHDPLFNTDELDKADGFKLTYDQFATGWGGFNNPAINPDWFLVYPFSPPQTEPAPPVVTPPVTKPPVPPPPPMTHPPDTPPITTPPTKMTPDVERRIDALAAWHGQTVNWGNSEEVQAWFDHLGSFGRQYATHRVGAGETLSGISGEYYLRQDKWRVIMRFNQMRVEWAYAGQNLRIPLLGDGNAHQTYPGNLPPRIAAMESGEFFDPEVEAPDYETAAPHSAGLGEVESSQIDDSEAAGFASDPDVTQNDFPAGSKFKAIWTFRNIGSTVWDDGYKLVHVPKTKAHTGGVATAQMAAKAAYPIAEVSDSAIVLPGDTITITVEMIAPDANEVVATHWQLQNGQGENFGKLRWVSAQVVPGTAPAPPITEPKPDPVKPDPVKPEPPTDSKPHKVFMPIVGQPTQARVKPVEYGMNINPNLDSGDSREIDMRDVDIQNQKGLGWVRYAYWASRNRRSGKEAFVKRYQKLIKTYAQAGIKTLIVLHQDTYWGHGPWDHGQWGKYAAEYGRMCAEVAAACADFKDMVAYQIFNETDSRWGDDAPNANKSAIGLPPEKYALILQSAAKSIRAVDPKATIVAAGMKTGPQNAVNYLKKVEEALRKPLPVDALAYHPYGRHAKTTFDFVPFGSLADAFKPFEEAFPDLPIWLTEIGVPGHQHVFQPNRYPDISKFMTEAIEAFNETHAKQVPVIVWFAWSDFSENSGIKTKDGRFKSGIKEAYDKMRKIS